MPKAYAVVTYRSVSDPEKLAAYAKLAGPAIAPFGARFLARGNAAVAREQGVKGRRIKTQTVLPSADTAAMLFWALLASGQINMRKIDGWQTLATQPIAQPIDLAA